MERVRRRTGLVGVYSALYLDGYSRLGVYIRVLLFSDFKLSYLFVFIRLRIHRPFY